QYSSARPKRITFQLACGRKLLLRDRADSATLFINNLRVAVVIDVARASGRNMQLFGSVNVRIGRAARSNVDSLGVKVFGVNVARAGELSHQRFRLTGNLQTARARSVNLERIAFDACDDDVAGARSRDAVEFGSR